MKKLEQVVTGFRESQHTPEPRKKGRGHLRVIPLPEWTATKNEMRAVEFGQRLERIAKSLEDLVAVFGGSIRQIVG
jgi:hypothetical protein